MNEPAPAVGDGFDRELGETEATVRDETSAAGRVVFWAGAAISVLHVYFNTLGTLSELWTSAIHFGTFGFLCALHFPCARGRTPRIRQALLWVDVVIGLLALACVAYLIYNEQGLFDRGVHFLPTDWVVSIVGIVLAIEFTRRTTGWIIPILIIVALTYVAWWGRYVEGIFHFPGLTLETVLFRNFFGTDGMFGTIARISSTYVFMFILFGAFLVRSGAGEFIIDLARCVAGRFVGGPGLVAVIGSGLMGSISGSAVANTVSTGVITIPLMKRAGFDARFAAGVEASASTGGQLMPPIMGAGAFIMSSYTQIPYLDIIAVSALPAIMYFLSVGFWVRIEAKRLGVVGLEQDDQPRIGQILRAGGHSLIPIAVLIGLLVYGFTPTYAAGISILAAIVASWLSPQRMGPRAIVEALALGARNMISTAVLLVAVGLVVNAIGTTGVGNTFSLMINNWAHGSLIVTIVLVALASLVLGMGLPVTAAYIVLGTLSAPAIYDLIAQAQLTDAIAAGAVPETARMLFMLVSPETTVGAPMAHDQAAALVALIPPELKSTILEHTLDAAALTTALLSAHMIIFWLSQDSNVTPPVCLTAFAAAAIAYTPPMATGLTAWKIAKGLYIVPLLFAYTPFLAGDILSALGIFAFGTVGIYGLTAAIEGYAESRLNWPLRAVLAAVGVLLLWPVDITWKLAGCAVFAAVMVLGQRLARRTAAISR
jgi:TRAP transporter 4TM/12TM fusion protein